MVVVGEARGAVLLTTHQLARRAVLTLPLTDPRRRPSPAHVRGVAGVKLFCGLEEVLRGRLYRLPQALPRPGRYRLNRVVLAAGLLP